MNVYRKMFFFCVFVCRCIFLILMQMRFDLKFSISGCLLGHGCVVAGACRSCTNGEKFACLKSTTLFAHCQGNSLLIRRCLSNSRFDVASGNCRMK